MIELHNLRTSPEEINMEKEKRTGKQGICPDNMGWTYAWDGVIFCEQSQRPFYDYAKHCLDKHGHRYSIPRVISSIGHEKRLTTEGTINLRGSFLLCS
jgi:hypothetical protein